MSRAREGEAYPEEVEEDEEYDEEEYDEEAEAAPRPARRRARARSAPEAVGPEVERRRLKSLSLSFLAMLPLFAAYEWAVVETGGERRNAAELLLGLPLLPLGDAAAVVRPCLLGLCALAAFVVTRRRGVPVRVGTARVFLEGLLAALVMGPVLIGGMALFGDRWPAFDVSWTPPAPPGLARAALAAGGAGWEELVFRVGVYGMVHLAMRRAALAVGLGRAATGLGEVAGLLVSSAAFAALHFRVATAWIFDAGLEFDPASFTWLCMAGILLGLLFRWRGPGVAAWCHGLFNVALLVGIDPDILR